MRSMKSRMMFALSVVTLACAAVPALHAQVLHPAPEIDPASLMSGLAVASAAVLMFRARRRAG